MKTTQFAVQATAQLPLVEVKNQQAVTTSLQIAQTFGKRHADVLRDVRILECSKTFQERNFALSLYVRNLPNNGSKKESMYYITRDGFTFLAMGFTGKVAAKFKEDYINAFNAMEQQLREIQQNGLVSANRLQIQQNETEYWRGMYAKAMNAYTESSKTMSLMSKNTLRITEMMVEYREALNTIEAEKITKQIETVKQIIQPVAKKKPALSPKKEPKYYYSVVGYATLKDVFLGIKKAADLGRKASALCRAKGIKTEEIPDPRFGRVKTYPESVLKEVFVTAECR